jgi:hypothetical protein
MGFEWVLVISEEMPELTETFENKNNNKIPEEKMAALYATVIKKNIYEEYDAIRHPSQR